MKSYICLPESVSVHCQATRPYRGKAQKYAQGLKKLPGITPIPSQANYITCILGEGISSKALTRRLLKNHNIFIKDLTPKIKGDREYIRVAVKTESENKLLLNALEKEI